MMYYQELLVTPPSATMVPKTMAHVFYRLHGIFSQLLDSNTVQPVGLTFPDFQDGPDPSVGPRLRLFSQSSGTLALIRENRGIADFRRRKLITMKDICPVPDYERTIQFSRVRRLEKQFSRGEPVDPVANLSVISSDQARQFTIFIERAVNPVETELGKCFTTYGLAAAGEGALPDWDEIFDYQQKG